MAPLSGSLMQKIGELVMEPGTLLAQAYGRREITEGYHCNFGDNPVFVADLKPWLLHLSHERDGDVQVAYRVL